jgi:hypothetical protein
MSAQRGKSIRHDFVSDPLPSTVEAMDQPTKVVGPMIWCEKRDGLEYCWCDPNCMCREVQVFVRPMLQDWERE